MAAAPQKPNGPQQPASPNQAGNAPRSAEAMVAAAAAAAKDMANQAVVTPSGDENDEQLAAAWGLTEKRRGMSREAVIGMLAVFCLLGLFGYVAWKKMKGRDQSVVTKNDPEVKTPDPFDDSTEVSKAKFNKDKDEDFSLNLDEDDFKKPPKSKTKEILDDTLDVGENQNEPTRNEQPEDNPFNEPPRKTATLDLDEFDNSPKKPQEPARLPQRDALEDDFSEPVRAPVAQQKTRKPTRLPDVDQFADNSQNNISELPPANDPPPTKNSSRHPLLRENEYLIEAGDNFCVISKKLYGTGKYFLALAEANKNRVADPCRMRPGLIISAPPREQLDRQFAELIPETRQAAGPGSDRDKAEGPKSPKRPSATAQAPGLYRDENGLAWYCVGEGDTLSGIAQDHLGRLSRAEQIINLNQDRLPDPHKLKIGQILRMPNDATPVRLVDTDREIR